VFVTTLLLALLTRAGATDSVASWDLAAASARVLDNGVDVREAALLRDAGEARLRQRARAGLPAVDLQATLGGGVAEGDVPLRPSVTGTFGAVVDLPLYAGGSIRADRAEAEADLARLRAMQEETRQATILGVAEALLDHAEATARAESAVAVRTAERALEARLEAAVAGGARTRADLLLQRAARQRAEADAVDAERAVGHARLALAALLRLAPDAPARIVAPAAGPEHDGDVTALVARARATHPRLRAATAAREARESAERAACAVGRPRVDLRLTGGTEVSGASGEAAAATAQLRVAAPIATRGEARTATELAGIERDRAALAEGWAAESVALAVHRAVLDRDAADARRDAADARAEAAEAAAEVAQARVDAGAGLVVELLTARAELANARMARASARVEAIRVRYVLAAAIGAL
jgi:outer membrane protein TolC